MEELSIRESEVLNFLILGWTNKQISDELCVTVDTTKAHITSLLRKLRATNRTEAVYIAIKNKIVEI